MTTSQAAQPNAAPTPGLNLSAYWYGFKPTGCEAVDKILHAVARAGKAFHSTEYWADAGDEGEPSQIDLIQAAADSAASWETAAERDRLVKVNEGLVKALEILRPMVGAPHDFTVGDVWKAQKLADEVLAAARKPTEAAGG